MNEKLTLFIKVKTQPGKREQVQASWEKHLKGRVVDSSDQPVYFFSHGKEDDSTLCLFEFYSDATQMMANARSEWFAAYMAEVGPMLAAEPEVTMAEPVWAKGATL